VAVVQVLHMQEMRVPGTAMTVAMDEAEQAAVC
jgi:hypothetical protein